ncbi:hypothetical protein FHW67_000853 [Herbaspirillum sp. Sphag1AN]|uniref:YXWGXW repeat-containing protein n=1 Tax=unclassified Herbaspirillum TaxID=2624150 RepID=UPI0016086E31|nr:MULTISPECIES: YXWGXW repeat-containing protein [unclassified Herbaspirillum]MBB3211605.1 hypothetical protein [Herbaspirillum sp. Sphag1AN]MBB3245128.1 hypothetical protein [Herbaspirillum sp. Sphag64]
MFGISMGRQLPAIALVMSTLCLSACVVEPPRVRIEPVQEHRIVQAPPAPIVEVIPAAPYSDSYWIPGHWQWEHERYVWNGGHWERARPNMVYQHAHWDFEHGEWIFRPGKWVELVQERTVAPVLVEVEPPLPRVEVMPPPPSPNHVWIGGYWRWDHGHHVWVGGHWEARREGYFWAPAHWYRSGNGWAMSGGGWQRY